MYSTEIALLGQLDRALETVDPAERRLQCEELLYQAHRGSLLMQKHVGEVVAACVASGTSLAGVGRILGITRQAAHQRYVVAAPPADPGDPLF